MDLRPKGSNGRDSECLTYLNYALAVSQVQGRNQDPGSASNKNDLLNRVDVEFVNLLRTSTAESFVEACACSDENISYSCSELR